MTEPWASQGGTPLYDTPESDLASLSPRTALLSPPYENAELVTRPRRINGVPNNKFRHERERVHAAASARDLLRLLVNEEYEAKQTRKVLYTALDRLDAESRRAEEAETQLAEALERTRSINEARVAAQQEAARSQEELRLYKLQLDNAQREILRAQDILGVIEAQRDDAEAAAADARSKARKLNEERLIELAREEGRRLGYEEGIRRGRNMGYREGRVVVIDDGRSPMREAPTATDSREEAEVAPVVLPPQSAPVTPMPESRTAPEVLRVSTPVSSSLDGRRDSRSRSHRDSESDSVSRMSMRAPDPIVMPVMVEHPRLRTDPSVTSQSSRSHSQPQPWPMSDRSSVRSPSIKPISVINSAPSVQHSEFQVPPDGYIPTLDKDQRILLPPPHELIRNMSSPTPSQPVAGPSSDSVRTFDYPRRASPESQASTKMSMSQSSTMSALEIIGLPNMTSRDKRRERNGLSIIHEDASIAADYETVTGSDAGHHHHRSERRNERDADSDATKHSRRDLSKQRLADELRWSNPAEPEEWRRYGAEKTRTQSSNGPPRPRPTNVTTPNPLSPLNSDDANTPLPRHQQHSRTASTPSQRGSNRYDHRRVVSSDSSVPEITIEPPSRPPSDAPSRRASISGLLSPDHANHPLPVPVPVSQRAPLVPTVPNTPVSAPVSLVGSMYDIGQLPSGAPPPGGPVIPYMNEREAPSQRSSLYAAAQPEGRRSQTPQSYVASPVPTGVSYPAPPISRQPTPNGSSQRGGSSSTHERRPSLSQMAGITPGAHPRSLQPSGGETSRSSHRQRSNTSSSSHQSFTHYDPGVYNDPAYFASSESLVSRTDANTTANGGGPRRTS